MILMYQFLAFAFELPLFICLSINELKIDRFLSTENFAKYPDRDFLDVDVTSDVLPTMTEVKDASADESQNITDIFIFKSKSNKSYKCWIESVSDIKDQISGRNDEMAKQLILNRRKSCYYFKGTSWVYEYCHLKSARQVSRTKINDNHEEFNLGRFYPPRQVLNFNRQLNYLDTQFFDGSFCELTGSPRSSHIRFICADEKQSMYITNVKETSACAYEFLIHVPGLCNYFPKHAKDIKRESKIKCAGYESRKPNKADSPTTQADKKMDDLDQILGIIETTYNDSSVLTKYKSLLLKATEKMKSLQLAKDISRDETDASLIDLLAKLSHKEIEPTVDHEENEDSETKN